MRKTTWGAAIAAAALLVAMPLPAQARSTYHQPQVKTINTGVVAPYSLALSGNRVYVADGGTSTVSRVVGQSLRTVVTGPQPGEVAGLDISRNRRYLAYTSTDFQSGAAGLTITGPYGHRVTADLVNYEKTKNPDRRIAYGVDNPSQCVKDAFAGIEGGPPVSYTGLVDSHPYAVASWGNSWIVADAAGNDLLRVSRNGHISTLAVLPRQPLLITKKIAAGMGLPHCVVGVTYNFEAVPTDVEVGRDGSLYVSTLAGGPEDPSLGARSAVYRVNPWTGRATKIASGLSGATDLAVSRDGQIYVAELFAGRISVIRHGTPSTYVELANPLSVEADHRGLVAGTMAKMGPNGPEGHGSIVRITR